MHFLCFELFPLKQGNARKGYMFGSHARASKKTKPDDKFGEHMAKLINAPLKRFAVRLQMICKGYLGACMEMWAYHS